MLRRRAFAKINLALRVLGVRADGFHELQTVFQSIALHDTLTIRLVRGPLRVTSTDPACPGDETNLVWRAAIALHAAIGRRGAPAGIAIHLAKRIPMQAGLGGGSSDAAVTLLALARLWRVSFPRLHDVAVSLGADVPYFLEGGTVLGLERGDALVPLADVRPAWVTLVVPRFGVSTRDAFRWWDEAEDQRGALNDLQPAIAAHHPAVDRFAGALERAGASCAAMTGSGSAVFGLFARRAEAERAARDLAGRARRTLVTRTVARAPYQRLAGIPAHRIDLPFAPRGFGHS
jgi:4-diphosphocytidyl-2-C-methyl-D-erythritol kinase